MKTVELNINDIISNSKELLTIVNQMITDEDYSRFTKEQLIKFKEILVWNIETWSERNK